MTPGPLPPLISPADWPAAMARLAEIFDGLRRAFEDMPRILDELLRPVRPAVRRAFRQVRLADHRRRKDARRVQAKVGRRQRSGRGVVD